MSYTSTAPYSLANFPNGFPGGETLFNAPLYLPGAQLPSSGNYLFVQSTTGADGNPGTYQLPLATLAKAVSLAAADTNWVIVLLPAHAETISAAGGITINKSGLTVIGLGQGANRPTFTFASSTAATFLITSANFTMTNVVGTTTVDQVVSPFVVQAANTTLSLEWKDGSAVLESLRAVLTSAAATNFRLNLKYTGFTAGSHVVNAVRLVGVAGARVNVDFYGVLTTAAVEFATTLCSNVQVTGSFYISGISNQTRMVVDTITGSLWSVTGWDAVADQTFSGGTNLTVAADDVSAVLSKLNVPSADVTTNTAERDVIGNKTDAAVTTVGATNSLMALIKGHTNWLTVGVADATTNAAAKDVIGNKSDATIDVVGTTKSLMAYTKGLLNDISGSGIATFPSAAAPANSVTVAAALWETFNLMEKVAVRAAGVLVNAQTIFTITGGPIEIIELYAYCLTTCDATASTLQFSSTPTLGSTKTISGASASLANLAAGGSVTLNQTALSTAPDVVTGANGGVAIGANVSNKMIVNAGTLTTVIGTGSTTGTFTIHLRYRPLARGITVA